MIHFAWPWLALVMPLPWLLRVWLSPADAARGAALRVPFLDELARARHETVVRRSRWPLWLAGLTWLMLVLAGTRPQWLGDAIALPVSGRDLMLAVDLSDSMRQTDFEIGGRQVNRLAATKAVADEFIARRAGDRIGLILFGDQAYLQTPLTFDRDTVRTLLLEAQLRLAGRRTAIGDAIGLAVKRLRDRPESNRVLILLTDGANTAGEVEPLQAAELAKAEGLTIYTIGIGAEAMVVRGLGGLRRIDPSAELDERTLTAIADMTGGRYFRARDTAELEQIYGLLDELEPIDQEPETFRPVAALYYWPLGAAAGLAALLFVYSVRQRGV